MSVECVARYTDTVSTGGATRVDLTFRNPLREVMEAHAARELASLELYRQLYGPLPRWTRSILPPMPAPPPGDRDA